MLKQTCFDTCAWKHTKDQKSPTPSVCVELGDKGKNVRRPLVLDVSNPSGVDLEDSYDVMMAANLVHITDWSNVVAFFELAGEKLAKTNGILFLYGPFAFQERFTFVHCLIRRL